MVRKHTQSWIHGGILSYIYKCNPCAELHHSKSHQNQEGCNSAYDCTVTILQLLMHVKTDRKYGTPSVYTRTLAAWTY